MSDEAENPPSPSDPPAQSPAPDAPGEPRRDFLQKAGSVVIGGAIVACPAAVGVVALTDPLRRDTGGGVLARLTTREALRPGAPPKVFKVVADRVDAWATTKNVPLGLVYARQTEDGEVIVFSATCPHAGCAVEYRNSEGEGPHYFCPCHASSFELDGTKRNVDNPSKRSLDTLEVDGEKLAQGEVWVRFQKFKTGVEEKVAIG